MSETPGNYACQEYSIRVAGRTVRLLGPKYPHDINYEPGGQAIVSDPGRTLADEFPDVLRLTGFRSEVVRAKAKAIPAFDAIDDRVMDGRVFRVFHAG